MKNLGYSAVLKLGFLSAITLFMLSCNPTSSHIRRVEGILSYAEDNLENFSEEDWLKLDAEVNELTTYLNERRTELTGEEIEKIGNLQGRYLRLKVKAGFDDFKDTIEDFSNQIEGLLKGLN